jgi:hypothetical protein
MPVASPLSSRTILFASYRVTAALRHPLLILSPHPFGKDVLPRRGRTSGMYKKEMGTDPSPTAKPVVDVRPRIGRYLS